MPYDRDNNHEFLREKIIGLGKHSIRKSYYPELQERLAELEKFRSLLDQSNDAIFLLQIPSGILVDMNESAWKQLEYTKEDLINRPFGDITEDIRIKRLFFKEKIISGERKTLNTVLIKKNGHNLPVEMTVKVVIFDNILYAVIVARDITERIEAEEENKKLQAQLLHAQKLESLGVLAGGIAHDFNNILTGILGNADLALRDSSVISNIRTRLEHIHTSARRAAELTRQMLAYAGLGKYLPQPVNMSNLVENIAKLLEVSISKKCTLKYEFQENLPFFHGDATQLQQVIMNLVINASESTGEHGGIITISTGTRMCDKSFLSECYLHQDLTEGLYIYLEVADTGCGIPKENQDKIFDPFFTTKFTGRGLGLAAVLGIVKYHRGTIKIISKPGEGTCLKLLFPINCKEEEKTLEEPRQGEGTILIVDDEECVCNVAKIILEDLGFRVITAGNGQEGLEIFLKHKEEICAVILDMTMPKMDGIETLKNIRLINDEVKIILSSGYSEKPGIENSIQKSINGFLQKPYDIKDLMEILRSVKIINSSGVDFSG